MKKDDKREDVCDAREPDSVQPSKAACVLMPSICPIWGVIGYGATLLKVRERQCWVGIDDDDDDDGDR